MNAWGCVDCAGAGWSAFEAPNLLKNLSLSSDLFSELSGTNPAFPVCLFSRLPV